MSLEDFTDYKLPKNAYLTFDADSLKSLIIERLNENETFRRLGWASLIALGIIILASNDLST